MRVTAACFRTKSLVDAQLRQVYRVGLILI